MQNVKIFAQGGSASLGPLFGGVCGREIITNAQISKAKI